MILSNSPYNRYLKRQTNIHANMHMKCTVQLYNHQEIKFSKSLTAENFVKIKSNIVAS